MRSFRTSRAALVAALALLLSSVGASAQASLQVPDGFDVAIFASGLDRPRFMAFSEDGVLFVADYGSDSVYALPDRDADGRADTRIDVGGGYGRAHSLAFRADGSLLVAGGSTLYEVRLDEDGRELERRESLSYPGGGAHSTRTIVVRPDGSLLLSIGSSCNACIEHDPARATIIEASADGSSPRILMRGLRNAVGLAIDPATGSAWATNNGRDFLGDDLPPETLYRVVDGADAGWPRCHAGTLLDVDFGDVPDPVTGAIGCEGVASPAATYQAHAAPLGLAFWRGGVVIAFHGSWNRSSRVGYEVLWQPWDDGPAGPAEPLLRGLLDPETGAVSGRPAGVIAGPDGALYVSDDWAGVIYRITVPERSSEAS